MVNVTEPIEGDAFLAGAGSPSRPRCRAISSWRAAKSRSVAQSATICMARRQRPARRDRDRQRPARRRRRHRRAATVVAGNVHLTGGACSSTATLTRTCAHPAVRSASMARCTATPWFAPRTRGRSRRAHRWPPGFPGPSEPQIAEGAVIVGGVDFERRSTRRIFDDTSGHAAMQYRRRLVPVVRRLFLAAALFLAMFPNFSNSAAATVAASRCSRSASAWRSSPACRSSASCC